MTTQSRRYVGPGDPEPAVPLLGGDVTEGLVRVGDTVRRPASDASQRVRGLLDFLHSAGFTGAPRFLGIDGSGRDTLSFVPGDTAGRPRPSWVAEESSAASVARLVRAYDDAVQPLGVPGWAVAVDAADPPGCPPSIAGPAWHLMRHRALTRGGGWRRMWDEGIGDKILRRQAWLAENAAVLHAAVA